MLVMNMGLSENRLKISAYIFDPEGLLMYVLKHYK